MRTVASASGTFTVWSEAHNKDTDLMGCRAALFSIMLHCTARHCTTAHSSTTKLQLTLHDAPGASTVNFASECRDIERT
mgnify:CR=1 FL=1